MENTHNRHGGTIISLEYIKKVHELTQKHNLILHLDGARIWNAHSVTKIPLKEYAQYFDTISVFFSKGLGAPVGSMLLSTRETIDRAWKIRKTFGGNETERNTCCCRKICPLYNLPKLSDDHRKAVDFTKMLSESDFITAEPEKVDSNIVRFALIRKLM